jgi:putative ABC transport system permease protein
VNVIQTLPIAARALFRNKTRSFLTALGVVIGVASVISMVAIGEGAKRNVEQAFTAMGTNLLVVTSGSTSSGGVFGGLGSLPTISWEDMAAIRRELPSVRAVAPLLTTKCSLVSDDANWTTSTSGTNTEYFDIRSWRVAQGSALTESDIESGNKVLLLGRTVAEHLFGVGVDPIGRTVRVNAIPFLVTGVLEKKGQSPVGQDYDDTVFMPYTTFQAKIRGGLQKYIQGSVFVGARSGDTTRAQRQIESLLRDRHHVQTPNDDDFQIRNLTEIANARQQGTKTLTALLAAIAIVSLLVGGIGIMNIMLVSVTERTREIGVRMAVGAKPWHILAQFLVEAVALSVTGGVIGVGLGTAVAGSLASQLGWPLVMRPDIVVVAVGFSALVGIGFGLYPARKASLLDPIEALRYE